MRKFLNIAVFVLAFVQVQAQVQMLFSSDSLFNITSPLAIDSLYYWFDASQGVTDSLGGAIANNEGVGTWNDLSGHGYHVTQTTNTDRPVYKTGAVSGYPGIQFDGSDDFLASAAHFWGSDNISIFVVAKWTAETTTRVLVDKYSTVSNKRQWRYYYDTVADSTRFVSSTNGTSATILAIKKDIPTVGTWILQSLISNGSSGSFYLDGSSIKTGTTSTIYDNSLNKLGIGAAQTTDGTLAGFFHGVISEIVIFSKNLSTTEQVAIEAYLNRKYDLYYFLILAFPVAGVRRRKIKEAA